MVDLICSIFDFFLHIPSSFLVENQPGKASLKAGKWAPSSNMSSCSGVSGEHFLKNMIQKVSVASLNREYIYSHLWLQHRLCFGVVNFVLSSQSRSNLTFEGRWVAKDVWGSFLSQQISFTKTLLFLFCHVWKYSQQHRSPFCSRNLVELYHRFDCICLAVHMNP